MRRKKEKNHNDQMPNVSHLQVLPHRQSHLAHPQPGNPLLLPFLLPSLRCLCCRQQLNLRCLRPRRIQIHQIVVLRLHTFVVQFDIESPTIPRPERLQLPSLVLLDARQQRIARVPEWMVARIFGCTKNTLGRRRDLLVGGPVGEDHDLVVKVRSFRAPEECGATGLREKEEEEEAREAWAGGAHAEEWSEESGRHGVGVVVGVVVFLGVIVWRWRHMCGGGSWYVTRRGGNPQHRDSSGCSTTCTYNLHEMLYLPTEGPSPIHFLWRNTDLVTPGV